MRRRDWGEIGFIASLLAPALALYLLLVLWPMAQSFWVALHRWRGVSGTMTFVGLENLRALLGDERFRTALAHNLLFFAMVATSVLTLSLFFAYALSRRLRGGELFRALFLFPNVVSVVAVSTLWSFLYNPTWGLVNGLLQALRLQPRGAAVAWLAGGSLALPAVAVAYVWYVLGFYILLFRAGIQNIAVEVEEAALMDGASEWQRFRCVTLPLLQPILRLAVIYLIINSMNVFALVWVMAPPSATAGASEVALTYLYQKGFVEQQFGYSTAVGAVNFLLVMGITVLLQRVWKID